MVPGIHGPPQLDAANPPGMDLVFAVFVNFTTYYTEAEFFCPLRRWWSMISGDKEGLE